MQITAVFDSIDEMLGFAGEILKSEDPASIKKESKDTTSDRAYGRQIAEHFPDANKSRKEEAAQEPKPEEKATEEPKQEDEAPEHSTQEEKTYTLVEVRAKLAALNKAGKKEQVQGLISSFGVEKLSMIDPEHYTELMEKAGEL
ncbi:MAG: hypothetical protein KH304_10765 [Clostridium sp.]|nr:hypothetical protein [Clostridium sp.]